MNHRAQTIWAASVAAAVLRGMAGGSRPRCRSFLQLSVALCGLGLLASPVQAKPEWVEHNGISAEHPRDRFVTGFGMAKGDEALERATQAASADLARKISVRIESEVNDVSQEKNGDYTYKLAAVTRSTTDVRVSNLAYEVYKKRGKVYVLAWVDRQRAARVRRGERDRALAELRACFAAGELEQEADRKSAALGIYESCRRPLAEALQHEAVAAALLGGGGRDPAVFDELVNASRGLDREIDSMLTRPASSLESAADAMALQLARQGVSTRGRIIVAHFNFGATNLSSSFGRQAGLELERALASAAQPVAASADAAAPDLAMRGVYLESDQSVRLSVTAREVTSGRLVASAEASMPRSAIPDRLELKPTNFEDALKNQRILAEGGLVSGDLQVEVWTDKGRGGVLYTASEELRLYMRVNQPAWIRLLYVLQSGAQVPIDQAYYVDASKVNMVVEYPDSFEIVAPFGVEMIHATAFTERPPSLETTERKIDGVAYQVVADGLDSIVRTRGLARKKKQALAEDTLTVTTTPRF